MTAFSFVAFSLPVFWLALMLQIGTTQVFLNWHVRLFYTSAWTLRPGNGLHGCSTCPAPGAAGFHVTLISIAAYSRTCEPRCSR